ncbi:MAG: pilus assembly protein TadG-related protein [Anaerolineae bacterium]
MNTEKSMQTERGQALIIMAFGIIVLLAIAGLAIDGGTVFTERRHAQNAADAAALTGARALAQAVCSEPGVDDATILAKIQQIVASNNVADAANSVQADYVNSSAAALGAVGSGTIPVGATGISATVTIVRQTYFLPVVGIDTSTASAYALAMTGPPLFAGGMRPFGLPNEIVSQLDPEDQFTISFTAQGGSITLPDTITPTQHRGWMNMGYMWNSGDASNGFNRAIDASANAAVIRGWMENGWSGSIYPDNLWSLGAHDGDFIHAKPGAQVSTICAAPEGVIFPVPVYDTVVDCDTEIDTSKPDPCPSQGSGYAYHIVGIASVKITACRGSPDKEIDLELASAIFGEGMPDIGEETGFGEGRACDTHTQVVTLWK